MNAPAIQIIVDYIPATGKTEVRFTAGGQQFAANVLLDVVAQIAGVMVCQNGTAPELPRGIVTYLLQQANEIITKQLKPGPSQVERIQVVK